MENIKLNDAIGGRERGNPHYYRLELLRYRIAVSSDTQPVLIRTQRTVVLILQQTLFVIAISF